VLEVTDLPSDVVTVDPGLAVDVPFDVLVDGFELLEPEDFDVDLADLLDELDDLLLELDLLEELEDRPTDELRPALVEPIARSAGT